MNNVRLINDERGVAIVTVLLILMLLSIVGVTATKTVIREKKIVRSEAVFEHTFYFAESGSLEGVQKLENQSSPDELLAALVTTGAENEGLLVSADTDDPTNETVNLDLDGDGDFDEDDVVNEFDDSDTNDETKRIVVQMPIASGSSLSLGSSRLYEYMSYGKSSANGGSAMIKMGYKKRF